MTDLEFQSSMDQFSAEMMRKFGGNQSFRMWSQNVTSGTVNETVYVSVSFPGMRDGKPVSVIPVISLNEWLDGVFEWTVHDWPEIIWQ